MTPAEDLYPAQPLTDDPASSRPRADSRRRQNRGLLPAVIVAFLLGGGIVGWLAWHGDLAQVLPSHGAGPNVGVPVARTQADVGALETRLAMLEDRFSRLDQQADEAAVNAGEAERLLIAQAVRRAIERGQPLGYLADQLRLRFADTQPRAVETLIAFAQRPVTLEALDAQLDSLTPRLAEMPREATSWERIHAALSGLLTIRSDAAPVQRSGQRIARVKLLLANGDVDAAADTIARLPGAPVATEWTADARRFGLARQALDVIESAAIETPRQVRRSSEAPASSQSDAPDTLD